MALRFMDSFDHYVTADMTKKWTSLGGSPSISAGNGRNGTQALQGTAWDDGPELVLDSQDTWIIGFAFKVITALPSTYRAMLILDEGGVTSHMSLGIRADGTLAFNLGTDSGGTLRAYGSTVLSVGTFYYLESYLKIHDTAGVIKLHINGVSETLTFVSGTETTQDTRNGGTTGLVNGIFLRGGTTATGGHYYDDLYICDGTDGTSTQGAANNDFLGDVRCEALYPNGNGNASQMVGSDGNSTDNYLLVDEATANGDTDYVASLTSGNRDTYTMTNLTATSGSIIGVQTNLWARKDDAGSRLLAPVFRIGSTDYAGSSVSVSDTYVDYRQIYGKSPASGSAWTVSEVNGLEFGPKIP